MMNLGRYRNALTVASLISMQAIFPAVVKAAQPHALSSGRTYSVAGTGPVETAGLNVVFVVRSNGTFVRISSKSGSEAWMEVPGFYGSSLQIVEIRPGKLLVLGEASSSVKSVLILDVVDRRIVDHFFTQDRTLSPDNRFLIFVRPSLPGRQQEIDESETVAVYDLKSGPASSHRPINVVSPEWNAGLSVYPSKPHLNGMDRSYLPLTPFQWSADSKSVAFVSASRNFSVPARRKVVEKTDVSAVVIDLSSGKPSVKTARLKACGLGDQYCGDEFTGVQFRENGILVETRSKGSAGTLVNADAFK